MNYCNCGCGTLVENNWVRGHNMRSQEGEKLILMDPSTEGVRITRLKNGWLFKDDKKTQMVLDRDELMQMLDALPVIEEAVISFAQFERRLSIDYRC